MDFFETMIANHFGITAEQLQQIKSQIVTVQRLMALYDEAKPLINELEPSIKLVMAAAKANG